MLLDSRLSLRIEAPVNWEAFLCAISKREVEKIQAHNKLIRISKHPDFQTQSANGQLEEPRATNKRKLDIEYTPLLNTFKYWRIWWLLQIVSFFCSISQHMSNVYLAKKCQTATYPQSGQTDNSPINHRNNHRVHSTSFRSEHTMYFDPFAQYRWKNLSTVISVSVNHDQHKKWATSNQHRRVFLNHQEEHTDCRVCPTDNGRIQIHQTNRHSNPQW